MVMDSFSFFDEHYSNNSLLSMSDYLIPLIFISTVLLLDQWEKLTKMDVLSVSVMSIPLRLINLWSHNRPLVGGFLLWLCSANLMLIVMNIFSMFPYLFSVSTNFWLPFLYGFSVWLVLGFSSFLWRPVAFFKGFLMLECGLILAPLLFFCEIMSSIARGVALWVRFLVNMSVSSAILHFIYTLFLMSFDFSSLIGGVMFSFMSVVSLGLYFVELGVSLFQPTIFCLISALIHDDHTI